MSIFCTNIGQRQQWYLYVYKADKIEAYFLPIHLFPSITTCLRARVLCLPSLCRNPTSAQIWIRQSCFNSSRASVDWSGTWFNEVLTEIKRNVHCHIHISNQHILCVRTFPFYLYESLIFTENNLGPLVRGNHTVSSQKRMVLGALTGLFVSTIGQTCTQWYLANYVFWANVEARLETFISVISPPPAAAIVLSHCLINLGFIIGDGLMVFFIKNRTTYLFIWGTTIGMEVLSRHVRPLNIIASCFTNGPFLRWNRCVSLFNSNFVGNV